MARFLELLDGRKIELLSPMGVWTMVKVKGKKDYIIVYHLTEEDGKYYWVSDMGYGQYLTEMKHAFKGLKQKGDEYDA